MKLIHNTALVTVQTPQHLVVQQQQRQQQQHSMARLKRTMECCQPALALWQPQQAFPQQLQLWPCTLALTEIRSAPAPAASAALTKT